MWCYRKILKVKWTERKTNEIVLNGVKEKRELEYNTKVRKDKLIGYLLCHDSLNKKHFRRQRKNENIITVCASIHDA